MGMKGKIGLLALCLFLLGAGGALAVTEGVVEEAPPVGRIVYLYASGRRNGPRVCEF